METTGETDEQQRETRANPAPKDRLSVSALVGRMALSFLLAADINTDIASKLLNKLGEKGEHRLR